MYYHFCKGKQIDMILDPNVKPNIDAHIEISVNAAESSCSGPDNGDMSNVKMVKSEENSVIMRIIVPKAMKLSQRMIHVRSLLPISPLEELGKKNC